MSNEDFAAELESVLNYNKNEIISGILDLVKRKMEDAPPLTAAEIVQAIEKSNLVHLTMLEWANRWVANEVANRLRCGVWNGITVDRLFDSIWTEQLDIAVKDRIRQKVYSAIDVVLKERLTTMFK